MDGRLESAGQVLYEPCGGRGASLGVKIWLQSSV